MTQTRGVIPAGRRRPGKTGNRGAGLVWALLLLVFLLPVVGVFLKRATAQLHHSTKEAGIKSARAMAAGMLTDLMRHLSQNAYEDHLNPVKLNRALAAFGPTGFTEVRATPNPTTRSILIEAWGKKGNDPNDPFANKKLTAVINLFSDVTRFFSFLNASGGTEIDAEGYRYAGSIYSKTNLSIVSAGTRFDAPVIVNGSFTGHGPDTVLNAPLYISPNGTATNATFNGPVYRFIPPTVRWPTINSSYYEDRSVYKTTHNEEWTFQVTAGGQGQLRAVRAGFPAVITNIPPVTGAVFYAKNCVITLTGVVRGRVTVVVDETNGDNTKGHVILKNGLLYANMTDHASAEDSLAVLAKNPYWVVTDGSWWWVPWAPDVRLNGIFLVEQTRWDGTGIGFEPKCFGLSYRIQFTGIRGGLIANQSEAPCVNGLTMEYDPNLVRFPPPALPARPQLVNWQLEGG